MPPYGEDGEPPFLNEWIEADESLLVLGYACISMLAASFHLYLASSSSHTTWKRQVQNNFREFRTG